MGVGGYVGRLLELTARRLLLWRGRHPETRSPDAEVARRLGLQLPGVGVASDAAGEARVASASPRWTASASEMGVATAWGLVAARKRPPSACVGHIMQGVG